MLVSKMDGLLQFLLQQILQIIVLYFAPKQIKFEQIRNSQQNSCIFLKHETLPIISQRFKQGR